MISPVTVPWHFVLRLQVKRSTQTHSGHTGLVLCTQKRIMNEKTLCAYSSSYTIMSWDNSRHVFRQRFSTCILRSVWFPSEICLENLQTVAEHRMPLCYWWRPTELKDVQVFQPFPPLWTLLSCHVKISRCNWAFYSSQTVIYTRNVKHVLHICM